MMRRLDVVGGAGCGIIGARLIEGTCYYVLLSLLDFFPVVLMDNVVCCFLCVAPENWTGAAPHPQRGWYVA